MYVCMYVCMYWFISLLYIAVTLHTCCIHAAASAQCIASSIPAHRLPIIATSETTAGHSVHQRAKPSRQVLHSAATLHSILL